MIWFSRTQPKSFLAVLYSAFFVIVVLLILMIAPIVTYQYLFRDSIYAGVQIDSQYLGKMSMTEAREVLQNKISQIDQQAATLSYQNLSVPLKLTNIGLNDPDLNYDIVTFDVDGMLNQAYGVGRGSDWRSNLISQAQAILHRRVIPLQFSINEAKLKELASDNFPIAEKFPVDASLAFDADGQPFITEESAGTLIDNEELKARFINAIHLDGSGTVEVPVTRVLPSIGKKELEPFLPRIKELVSGSPLTLTYLDQQWVIPAKSLGQYLSLVKKEGQIVVAFNGQAGKILEPIKKEIDILPSDAVMDFKDGKLVAFEPSHDGLEVNTENTLAAIDDAWIKNNQTTIALTVTVAKPKVEIKDLNSLGIKEIVGVGESNYSNSPVNRRSNIAVGAKSLDATIINDGEEFSLIKALGNVDASNGYKEELVIKGNKTEPEFGGGLCQIGTTLFRAALQAGLKITERHNHSYRVSYYEPAGTDATIYSPSPDLRFINDTGHTLLLKTINDTKNSKLYFQFWGTSDGRKVAMTKPVVYNIVKPPDAKLVETLDLKPGVKKCTERAHNGADAYFTRTITAADGTSADEKFSSHYRPWQEVCLIGVEKLSVPADTAAGSDSPVTVLDSNAPAASSNQP